MKITTNFIKQTKRHLSASGSILLPLALKWRLVTIALCALAASALPTIISSSAHATSLTISIPKNPLTVNVSANFNGGFSTASGTLKISGDAAWGYTLTVKFVKNSLSSEEGNELKTIEKATSQADFPVNRWGYMPNKLNSENNTQYLPGPTSTETTIDNSSSVTTDGTEYTIALAAKVDATQPAGLYSGSFTFTATANAINYNISYDCNGVPGCIENTKGQTQEKITQLSSKEPTREGYNFLGWCTTQPTPDKYSEDECLNSGKKYDKSSAFELTDSTNEVTLYAMWQKQLGFEEVYALNNKTQENGHYKMQDMTPEICEHVTIPSEKSTVILVDIRDNNTYTVAKLLDGRCWMTRNLKIAGKELTKDDSDVDQFTLPERKLDGSSFASRQEYNEADVYIDPGTEAGHEDFGGYYTWFAATAGSGNSSYANGKIGRSDASDEGATYWWSSTFSHVASDNHRYINTFKIYNEGYNVSPSVAWAMHRGFSVRCIARNEE